MEKFKKIWWRPLFGLYVFIYLPWFFYLEHKITLDYPGISIMNGWLDELIPFCEYFIIPYIMWFFYIVAVCVLMVIAADNREFIKFALSLIIGMSLAMTICMVWPNGVTLRPEHIPDNIFGKIVAGLYVTDTSTNVFPSVHVYNSLAAHIALAKCTALKKHKVLKMFSLILCILICLSTVFLKQHAIYDVIGACVQMCILYAVLYILPDRIAARHADAEPVSE